MYFPIVGNHDLYFDGWKHFRSNFGTSSYLFVVNTLRSFLTKEAVFGIDWIRWGTLGKRNVEPEELPLLYVVYAFQPHSLSTHCKYQSRSRRDSCFVRFISSA